MAGRKSKLESDPSLAREHAKGTKVVLALPVEHAVLGTVMVRRMMTFEHHRLRAEQAHERLLAEHGKIAALDVDGSNTRLLPADLTIQVYDAGADMVVHTMLAAQHFCAWAESMVEYEFDGDGILNRLDRLIAEANLNIDKAGEPYQALVSINEQRRRIEHPTPRTLQPSANERTAWDQAPQAWFASDKPLNVFPAALGFLHLLASEMQVWLDATRSERPTTLSVDRGLKSLRPAKKPKP